MEAGAKGKTYKIGQAAKLLDVKPFVLRFWEGEFKDVLVPVRTPSGQRAYTEANVALVREIKRLLYDEGLTIDGAKKRLRESKGKPAGKPAASPADTAAPAPPRAAAGVQPSLLDAPPGTFMPGQGAPGHSAPGHSAPDPALQEALAAAQASAQAAEQEAAQAKARAEALSATLSEAASELQAIRALLAKGPAH